MAAVTECGDRDIFPTPANKPQPAGPETCLPLTIESGVPPDGWNAWLTFSISPAAQSPTTPQRMVTK